MSIRDFLARLSTQPSPPIASIAPIELENTFEAPTLDAPRNGKGAAEIGGVRDAADMPELQQDRATRRVDGVGEIPPAGYLFSDQMPGVSG